MMDYNKVGIEILLDMLKLNLDALRRVLQQINEIEAELYARENTPPLFPEEGKENHEQD